MIHVSCHLFAALSETVLLERKGMEIILRDSVSCMVACFFGSGLKQVTLELTDFDSNIRQPQRLGKVIGKNNKPSIVISKCFSLYLGNPHDSTLTVGPCELFGFGTGAFKEKLVSDMFNAGTALLHALCFLDLSCRLPVLQLW